MTANEFVSKVLDIAKHYNTLYVMGCFGAPLTAKNKARYANNHSYNRQAARTALINAASTDTFGFDCVGLIKGILWGWNGDKSATYGGAKYEAGGVPDISADAMISRCTEVSTDFSGVVPGAALWKTGHIGVYIGNGYAVECTPAFADRAQITTCGNVANEKLPDTTGIRVWTKWGKLPWIDYSAPEPEPEEPKAEEPSEPDEPAPADEQEPDILWEVPERYNTVAEMPEYYREEAQKLIDRGALRGRGAGKLDVSEDMLRCLIICQRMIDGN